MLKDFFIHPCVNLDLKRSGPPFPQRIVTFAGRESKFFGFRPLPFKLILLAMYLLQPFQ